jgi:integrase
VVYMMSAQNFEQQTEQYLTDLANRRRNPARPTTLAVYRSMLKTHALPVLGGMSLSEVGNKAVKMLVGRLAEANLAPATITLTVKLVKQVMASAVDEEGNQMFPRVWNANFLEMPEIGVQNAPITPLPALETALGATNGDVKALIGLLAGTGLRISEALALGVEGGNLWDPIAGTVTIKAQKINGRLQPSTKTKAGARVVDLPPAVNSLLQAEVGGREGALFPMSDDTYRRRIDAFHIPGFHSMRRLRITHLQGENAPPTLIKFWAGHAAGDITEKYTKMGSEVKKRKEWSEKAGLGFTL